MIVKSSSVRLDKILINCRRDLIWLAYILQVNKESNPGVLPAFVTWDLCVKALSLRHCTTLNKYSLIHCSDGCTIIHCPLQTLTLFHSTPLHWTVLLAIAAFYWVGEKNKQKIPRKELMLRRSPLRILHESSFPWHCDDKEFNHLNGILNFLHPVFTVVLFSSYAVTTLASAWPLDCR